MILNSVKLNMENTIGIRYGAVSQIFCGYKLMEWIVFEHKAEQTL